MINKLATLTGNDLAIAFRNKTLYLIIFMPLFVFLCMELLDARQHDTERIGIGLIEHGSYPPGMVQSIQSADDSFAISWLADERAGGQWLSARAGDGVLLPPATDNGGSALLVLDQSSLQTVLIVETVSALQRALEERDGNWITAVRFLRQTAIQRQMLPTWVLMLVLLVGFIVIPTQVAEEKEKKLLLGLLQTPIREADWLLAKVFVGMILIVLASALLHLLIPIEPGTMDYTGYVVFLFAGGFCFSACGILVGFLCRTQASARTLGIVFYLPHLLPSALADFSEKLSSVAPLLPSYSFYQPIRSILLEDAILYDFPLHLLALFGIGLFAICLSHRLMKIRWLM